MGVVERSINISGSSLGTGLEMGRETMVGEVLAAIVAAGVTANGTTVGGGEAVTRKKQEEVLQELVIVNKCLVFSTFCAWELEPWHSKFQ